MADNAFNTVEMTRPNGSWFDLTHNVKMTGNFGRLLPCMVMECYPGDKVKTSNELFIRTQPLVAPTMDRLDAFVHTFFVPHRITWEEGEFEKFMKGDAVTLPYLDIADGPKTLSDYLGYPEVTGPNSIRARADLYAAYQRIFFEYYRDQNLSAMTDNDKPYALSGNNAAQAAMLKTIRKRAYKHDYFTSALPFTQKGTEAGITVSFTDVPVGVDPDLLTPIPPGTDAVYRMTGTALGSATTATTDQSIFQATSNIGAGALFAATSQLAGTVFTINDFRLALATQHWLERMAIGGTRYTEINRAHFGVSSSDKTLQRPEYIGGLKTPIVISEIQNTTGELGIDGVPQGTLSGHGLAASYSDSDSYFCEEHGWMISILSVMPQATYYQGVPRSLDWHARNTRDEWLWPEFATLGEQAIKQREIHADNNAVDQEVDWGYTGRYNELRYIQNRLAGEFKTTLNYWSAARELLPNVSLSESFLTIDSTAMANMFGVSDLDTYHPLICHVLNKLSAFRLLPKFPTPELRG